MWAKAEEELPKPTKKVLAAYQNDLGRWRRIIATYIPAKTVESSPESECGEYDEETDTYYDMEGWYEHIENWDDYTSVYVSHQITHWQELPEFPNEHNQT